MFWGIFIFLRYPKSEITHFSISFCRSQSALLCATISGTAVCCGEELIANILEEKS